jgi:hypothetical protein
MLRLVRVRCLREIVGIIVTDPTPDLLAAIHTVEDEKSIVILAVSILSHIVLS